MGCCGESVQISTMEFTLELYDLIQDPDKKTVFQFKKLNSANAEKLFDKNLTTYIKETNLCKTLGDDFKFTINNSLFYCYLNTKNAIVKNYLQVKELVPLSYETLHKIAIVLTNNYNQLYMPKINLINKTKNIMNLSGNVVDISDVMLNRQYIFDPNLSKDMIIFRKPNLIKVKVVIILNLKRIPKIIIRIIVVYMKITVRQTRKRKNQKKKKRMQKII